MCDNSWHGKKSHHSWSKGLENPYWLFVRCYNFMVTLILFILSCSLADYWQTQSFCFHKELMKRTIGKPTYAFEARDYVVSWPVTARALSHGSGTNPSDSTKTGDPATKFSPGWPGHGKSQVITIKSAPSYFIWKARVGKRNQLPKNNRASPKRQWTELGSARSSPIVTAVWEDVHGCDSRAESHP